MSNIKAYFNSRASCSAALVLCGRSLTHTQYKFTSAASALTNSFLPLTKEGVCKNH